MANTMDDYISRQAAIDALYDWEMTYDWDDHCREEDPKPEYIVSPSDAIKRLPPAEQKKGKWISADAMFGGVPFYCSECGENTRDTVMGKPRWKFCPMCGAKMEVTE